MIGPDRRPARGQFACEQAPTGLWARFCRSVLAREWRGRDEDAGMVRLQAGSYEMVMAFRGPQGVACRGLFAVF